jgi:hypothetical protein
MFRVFEVHISYDTLINKHKQVQIFEWYSFTYYGTFATFKMVIRRDQE